MPPPSAEMGRCTDQGLDDTDGLRSAPLRGVAEHASWAVEYNQLAS